MADLAKHIDGKKSLQGEGTLMALKPVSWRGSVAGVLGAVECNGGVGALVHVVTRFSGPLPSSSMQEYNACSVWHPAFLSQESGDLFSRGNNDSASGCEDMKNSDGLRIEEFR